ncbi:MAG: hypothetical protein ABL895_11785 [Cyclobacteriaceae bacterium]
MSKRESPISPKAKKAKPKKASSPKKSVDRFGKIPKIKENDLSRWADYFELLCIANVDKCFTKGEVVGMLNPFLKDEIVIGDLFEPDDTSTVSKTESTPDKLRNFSDELFKMLEYRVLVYQSYYPFKIVEGDTLQLKGSLYIKNKLYLYLLWCSNLLFFPEKQHKLTTEFEYLSCEFLKRFLSPNAVIHHFGANVTPSKYKGKLYDKIATLAEDLDCELIAAKEDFDDRDTGDGGIDLVAWYPFTDQKFSRLIVLAQCKCSETWIDTRFSSSLEAWMGKINFRLNPNNLTFIPMCFRKQTGAWHVGHHVTGTILVDRQRLIEKIGSKLNFFKSYESVKFVNTFLK